MKNNTVCSSNGFKKKSSLFLIKIRTWWEKINFQNLLAFIDQNENYKNTPHVNLYKENKQE